MPEDHEQVAEAAEHAVEAIGESKGKQQLPALLLAGAAFLASLGAFIKTFDHSTTEGTYKTTSELITKLSDQTQKNQEDIASLRGYLDGLTHAPLAGTVTTASTASPPPVDAGPQEAFYAAPTHPHPVASAAPALHGTAILGKDAGVISFVIPPPPEQALPPARAPAAPVKPPPFDIAVRGL